MKKSRIIIVGSGITGASTAYHLAKLGWKDITVLDQGSLFETGGSTTHAPGGVFQTNASRMMCKFAQYTVKFLSSPEYDGKTGLGGGKRIAEYWKDNMPSQGDTTMNVRNFLD